ncbi:hypothetical protein Q1695_013548 [Nippostrongylus brasiliensis]|nr:hypothetical protein Q1695_013548 [Nippostrongylus brasiliensis]
MSSDYKSENASKNDQQKNNANIIETQEDEPELKMEVACVPGLEATWLPFIIGGLGSISAGLALNRIQKMALVCEVPQFIAMCPPLQGMKGNLDNTFTSRLGTMAHQGRFEATGYLEPLLRIIILIQAQAVLISLFATLITFVLELLKIAGVHEHPPVNNYLFLGSNALFAMCIACAISSFALLYMVVFTYRHSLNPDNVVSPLAASIGDLFTIGVMIGVAVLYYPVASLSICVPIVMILIFLAFTPVCLRVAYKDEEAWRAARQQGPTLLLAAILSSGAGIIQAFGATMYPELTIYQPLMAGAIGNRASTQSSRISSYLHTHKDATDRRQRRLNPWEYYTSRDSESRTAFYLVSTTVPYQMLYVFISHLIAYVALKPLKLNVLFLFGYAGTAFIQALFVVYLAEVVVYTLFGYGIDPDLHAIPMLTSIGDLCGTSLLLLLFYLMHFIDDTVVVSNSHRVENTTAICSYE